MKKLFIVLFLVLCFAQNAFSSNIEVLPTMQTKTSAQDKVWVGSFQIVWNDLMDKLVFDAVRFADGTPNIVYELNKQEICASDINNKSYYKYVGKISASTPKTIKKAIKKKFNETSDILDNFTFDKDDDGYFLYTMLYKNFKFLTAFDKLGKSKFKNNDTEFFGITKTSDNALKENVHILFYNSPTDFAVSLNTTNGEEVYLYRTDSNKPFNAIYAELLKKEGAYSGSDSMGTNDEFKAPVLNFYEEKQFDELANHRIKGTRLKINKAMETVKFNFNNEGGQLKSEAAISIATTSLPRDFYDTPKLLYFDDTFVMFLKEKNKNNPYFALRVFDINNYQN